MDDEEYSYRRKIVFTAAMNGDLYGGPEQVDGIDAFFYSFRWSYTWR